MPRIAIVISVAFLIAVLAGSFGLVWPLVLVATVLLALTLRRKLPVLALALGLILVVLGVWRGQVVLDEFNYLASLDQRTISVTGKVLTSPTSGAGNYRAEVGGSKYRYQLVTKQKLAQGDQVELIGNLSISDPPWDRYNFSRRLVGELRYPKVKIIGHDDPGDDWFANTRSNLMESLKRNLDSTSAGFASGLLLGSKASIPADLKHALTTTGTMHLIALSGYNITILIVVLARVLTFLSLKARIIGTLFALVFFLLLVGLSPSVLRAALMGVALLVEPFFGRKRHELAVLFVVAAAMTLVVPALISSDPGFQLSFAATLGILWLDQPIKARLSKLPEVLAAGLATTLAAQIMTLPLLAYYFGNLSLSAPLVNLLVLPLIPLAMLMSAVAALGGWVPWVMTLIQPLVVASLRLPLAIIMYSSRLVPAMQISGFTALGLMLFLIALINPFKKAMVDES